jgi:hypothetical protein
LGAAKPLGLEVVCVAAKPLGLVLILGILEEGVCGGGGYLR